MTLTIIDILVRITSYTMILYGIWLLIGQYFIIDAVSYISQDIQRKRYVKRLNRIKKDNTFEEKETIFLNEHIQVLIDAVSKKAVDKKVNNKKETRDPVNFYILSLFLFSTTFMLLFLLIKDLLFALVVGIFMMMIPYLVLRMRLANKRMKTSLAFLNNFHIIMQSYTSSSKSVYYMIRDITEDIDDKELKRTFIKLLASMQQDRSEDDFREAIKVFSYTIHSSFAIRLGNLISKAHLEAVDISTSLSDLNTDITNRKADLENEKSLNSDTKFLGYLPIITMPVFTYAAWKLSLMYNFWSIFNQKIIISLFLLAVILSIICLFAVKVLMKPRSDI